MAESADILSAPHQKVILPNLAAGCSMADMADPISSTLLARASRQMGVAVGRPGHVHEFRCLDQGVLRRARRRRLHVVERSGDAGVGVGAGEKLLMLPDQHLGRNTAFKMGVPLDEMVVWDPDEAVGRPVTEDASAARA